MMRQKAWDDFIHLALWIFIDLPCSTGLVGIWLSCSRSDEDCCGLLWRDGWQPAPV